MQEPAYATKAQLKAKATYDRAKEMAELRTQGMTWSDIASTFGYATPAGPHCAVRAAGIVAVGPGSWRKRGLAFSGEASS